MDRHVQAVAQECTQASDEERISFGEVVMRLTEAGVERYHADLIRAEKTYYMPDGTSLVLANHVTEAIAPPDFSAAGVEASVRAIQSGTIRYREFCRRIVEAGCVGYFVSIAGRCAVYYGRTCETHVERFPQPG